jgi:membrane-associated phospholipid phosphatase
MKALPANLWRGTVGVFSHDNLGPFIVGGAAASIASIYDDDVRNSIGNDGEGQTLSTAGGPFYVSLGVVGLFTVGRFTHNTRFRAMTYDLANAAIVNLAYSELLKVTVRRERPNGADNKSFPSGHASNAFTLATVVDRHYGWKIGVPAYLFATGVGISRLQQNAHWLSDVVAGSALGYIVGRTVVRVNNKPVDVPGTKPHATWNLSPTVSRHAGGLYFSLNF